MQKRMHSFWSLAAVAGLVCSSTAIFAADPPAAGESVELPRPGTLLWADAPVVAARPVEAKPSVQAAATPEAHPGFFARLFGRGATSAPQGAVSTGTTKGPLAD